MRIAHFLFAMACVAFGGASVADRPNLIVVFTDDHGYADLSAQGVFNDIKTPHIDSLASGGVRMTSGYSSAPQCVPSRAGLLTGKYQNRFGVESNGMPLAGFDAELTIAERLKTAGYATGMIGKWHLGAQSKIVDHGFDDVFYQGGSWTNFDFDGNDVTPGTVTDELYHLDAGSAAAKSFIKRHHKQPFFLYVAYRAPHVPLDATKKYLDRFPGKMPERRRQALAMLSAVDDGVGGILDSLREYEIEENTLIFVIGDNGAPLKIYKEDAPGGGPGWDGSLNDPMNGEKGMLSEGGIRVPFVVYWKGTIDGGRRYDHPVISLDVAATALQLAGLPKDATLDGVNLIPFLTGKIDEPPHETLYWRWIAQSALRQGEWKYLRGGARDYLFNLSRDKEEQHDVLDQYPEVANRLRDKLTQWSQALDPPGIETKQMSPTWETYFDFYLDGKPAPPLPPRRDSSSLANPKTLVAGWLARNATISLRRNHLEIRPTGAGKHGRPFITASQLHIKGPINASVNLRSLKDGEVGFAWREQGQGDFPGEQVVSFKSAASDEMQRHQVTIPTDAEVIHVRFLLPSDGADIESITFSDKDNQLIQRWNFAEPTR